MTISLPAASQDLSLTAKVTLFRLDATSVGAAVYYFTPTAMSGGNSVTFGGQVYQAVDITMDGFEVNAGGVLPTPKMQIANSDLFIQSLVNQFGDLAGCEIRRVRTFGRFLDGQPDADPTAFIGPDVFRVERKSDENPVYIEWELSAAIDQEGKMLPGRQFLRDICMRRYRHYNPTASNAAADGYVYPTIFPCKYTGSNAFDELGNPALPANDKCGRRLSDCKLRFRLEGGLPTGAFPGIGRVPM
jgi:lambda family phage minor tail protein L